MKTWLDDYLRLPETAQQEFISVTLREKLAQISSDPPAMLDGLFLNAIKTHGNITKDPQDHIYLKQFEIPQIILFDILINKLPFVVNAHAIINKAIASELKDSSKAVLIDAGIGRGLQTISLIHLLHNTSKLEELTIIGIELAEEALGVALEAINDASFKTGIRINFIPILAMIEGLEPGQLRKAIPSDYDRLIVNSSLTLHHIPAAAQRSSFFRLMGSIKADHIFLTEPDSDHFTSDWQQRLQNAYRHYRAVFEVIDQLEITSQEKNGLKMFFGREIDDVVGNPDDQRFEKHEPGGHWVDYLEAAGYGTGLFDDVPSDIVHPGVQFRHLEKIFLSIGHNGVGVLALLHGQRIPKGSQT